MDRIFAKLLYMLEKKLDTVLVTIIADQGSAPRGAGSQMLVGSEGRILGTIGGGAVEGNADAMAHQLLTEHRSCCHLFQLHEAAKENIGMVCGGGHCAQALAPLLHTVGFRVTIFEGREEYGCRENFPTAERIIVGDYTKIADYLQFTGDDYIVIMTNGHSFDLEVQDQVLRGDFAYVGVIGSRKKTAAVNAKLRERGVSEEAIARVHTPIGTPIKAVTPEEIAVSIAGELIYTRALRREATGFVPTGCPMH